jgi:hypothetical protein
MSFILWVTNRYKAVLVKISNLQDNYYKYQTSSFINSSIISIQKPKRLTQILVQSVGQITEISYVGWLLRIREKADRGLPF